MTLYQNCSQTIDSLLAFDYCLETINMYFKDIRHILNKWKKVPSKLELYSVSSTKAVALNKILHRGNRPIYIFYPGNFSIENISYSTKISEGEDNQRTNTIYVIPDYLFSFFDLMGKGIRPR